MSFLLRSASATALLFGGAFTTQAQSGAAASPALPNNAAVLDSADATMPSAQGPLLPAAQVKGEKYKTYLYKRYADDKEARAVVHLFARKQTGGALWLTTGAVVITFISTQTGTKTTSSGTTTTTVTPLGYGLLVGLSGGVGIGKLARFGNGKLYEVLTGYEKTHTLPGYVMEKLKDKDRR